MFPGVYSTKPRFLVTLILYVYWGCLAKGSIPWSFCSIHNTSRYVRTWRTCLRPLHQSSKEVKWKNEKAQFLLEVSRTISRLVTIIEKVSPQTQLPMFFSGIPEVRGWVQDPDRQLVVPNAARDVQPPHPAARKPARGLPGSLTWPWRSHSYSFSALAWDLPLQVLRRIRRAISPNMQSWK